MISTQPEDTFIICNYINGCLQDNETDKGNNDSNTTIMDTFAFSGSDTCSICNGYYGPCFEDPVCSTCHAFLFPNTVPSSKRSSYFDNSSDSDSGNDEPVDNGHDQIVNISFEAILRKTAPIRVETLAVELQRLSVVSSDQITDLNLDSFPPEVLMHMFQYLDEISLWSIGQVCSRWREILFMCVKHERWRDFTQLRWPLLKVENVDQDWYELYTSMMLSACCFKCVKQMAAQSISTHWEENLWGRKRLRSEVKAMRNDPLDGIEAVPLDVTCCHWQATIEGPAGSPYEGGLFFLYIQVPWKYPLHPPIVRFITKIFHPNVSRHGDIGIDSINHNWSLALTISKLLISIQSLLTDPYCDVCMEPEIGKLYMQNRKEFEKQARLWTALYAMHDLYAH